MNILLKSVNIIDSESDFDNKTQDVLIENGIITNIKDSIKNTNAYPEIISDDLHISQGWFDSSVSFGEPGYETRETIDNGLETAAKSGFTSIAVNSNTNPVIDSNSAVSFLKSKAINSNVNLHPIGALTLQSKGEHLAEIYDMKLAGAVAFYDYKKAISNANLMKIALQYASTFNGLICSFPQNNSIAGNGTVNEHITSTTIGLKGIPNIAEEIQIERDLSLLDYTKGKLHIATISTAKSVELIRKAKLNKLDVTCSVAIHNLFFDDKVLTDFNTNYKVLPPLRTQQDIKALIEGVNDGTIDMVTSDHNPIEIELKKIEFDHAAYGSIGLESAFGALNTLFSTRKTIKLLNQGKSRFGINHSPITIGSKANMTLFTPNQSFIFAQKNILSKSKNSIFTGQQLKGKALGIINNNKITLH